MHQQDQDGCPEQQTQHYTIGSLDAEQVSHATQEEWCRKNSHADPKGKTSASGIRPSRSHTERRGERERIQIRNAQTSQYQTTQFQRNQRRKPEERKSKSSCA